MLKNILIATDLSKTSDNLIASIKELKKFGTSKIVLTTVIDLKYSSIIPKKVLENAEKILNFQAESLSDAGFNVKTDLRQGTPWLEILESAKKNKANMIIAGSHGKSIVKEIFIGSVTSELIEQSKIPILIIKMDKFDKKNKIRNCSQNISELFDNVLLSTDFTDKSAKEIDFIKKQVKLIKDLTLIHVQEPILTEQPIEINIEQLDAIDRENLEKVESEIGIKAKSKKILHGLSSLELTDFVNENNFSLVILGTKGYGLTARLLLGSVSRYVIRHTKSPVLIIPKNFEG